MEACSDGTFNGIRYFTCPRRHGFFVHLHNCLSDSRFHRNSMEDNNDKHLTATGNQSSIPVFYVYYARQFYCQLCRRLRNGG